MVRSRKLFWVSVLVFFIGIPGFVFAARDIPLQIGILGRSTVLNIADYIGVLYQYLVGLAGLMAVAMIMYAGMKWIFAGGDKSKISAAHEIITHAVIGLVLALGSYLILNTVNPALVELEVPKVDQVGRRLLPGAWCPNEEEFFGDFTCGRQFDPKTDSRLGGLCTGSHCDGNKSCRRSRDGQSYACLDPAICPSSCDAINSMPAVTSDALLRIACESNLCEATIPLGCTVLEVPLGTLNHPTTKCVDAAEQGDHCSANADCGRGLYCVTARGYNSCEPSPEVNLPNWEDCDLGLRNACGPASANPRSKCIDTTGTDGDCSDGAKNAPCDNSADCQGGLRCHDCRDVTGENNACGPPGDPSICNRYSFDCSEDKREAGTCYTD